MKDNEHKKQVVHVTEGSPNETADVLQNSRPNKSEKLKKPIIFGLMGIVFAGCMYLILKPSSDKKGIENIGLNEAVPQATGAGMPDDKSKAYEQAMQEQKEQEKRKALLSLSDYWNSDSTQDSEEGLPEEEGSNGYDSRPGGYSNRALNSYRNAQSTLGSFYQDDNGETEELRRQLDELKEKLAEKDVPATVTVDDQLALMEQSYQMAAKYLPANTNTAETASADSAAPASSANAQKEHFVAFTPTRKKMVSGPLPGTYR